MTLFSNCLGMFMLVSGAATLNNYQDRQLDKKMQRTKNRVLPTGIIPGGHALWQSMVLIVSGLVVLNSANANKIPVIIGLTAVICYNGFYTPLKSKTMLALVPGTICGMLPPLVGWFAAGAVQFSGKIWIVILLLGLWQLPHFWLILLVHRCDYRQSGYPSMMTVLSETQLKRVVFMWVLVFSVVAMMLPLYQVTETLTAMMLIILNSSALIFFFAVFLFGHRPASRYNKLFYLLQGSMALLMGIVVCDQLLLHI